VDLKRTRIAGIDAEEECVVGSIGRFNGLKGVCGRRDDVIQSVDADDIRVVMVVDVEPSDLLIDDVSGLVDRSVDQRNRSKELAIRIDLLQFIDRIGAATWLIKGDHVDVPSAISAEFFDRTEIEIVSPLQQIEELRADSAGN